MKVAAYQAPLFRQGSMEPLERIQNQIRCCESNSVEILCCPEAVLGGLADYSPEPEKFAINVDRGELEKLLAPLASTITTVILGFTELCAGRLYNTAAVYHRGMVIGIYRKHHPAINQSRYHAGGEAPVFTVNGLKFGIIICNDSNFAEPASRIVSQGASVLFIPSNNGLPRKRARVELISETRKVDANLVRDLEVFVVRADVSGSIDDLVCHGTSAITGFNGTVAEAAMFSETLLVAEI